MWTEARVEELKTLWADHSASEIAERFGTTRNAVIGKINRLGRVGAARARPAGNPWPDEALVVLREMWPAHSHSETAKALAAMGFSFSREAVARKGGRIGLPPKRPGPSRSTGPRIRKPQRWATTEERRAAARERMQRLRAERKATTEWRRKLVFDPPPAPDSLGLGILDLQARHCRFPIGDPKEPGFGFCGSDREGTHPYCLYHMGLAYRPAVEKRLRV